MYMLVLPVSLLQKHNNKSKSIEMEDTAKGECLASVRQHKIQRHALIC